MQAPPSRPTLEAFLEMPREQFVAQQIAPTTLIYASGGTRRSAVLAGIEPSSDSYAAFGHRGMLRCCNLIFGYGVRHIFATAIRPGQFAERGRYRDRLLAWVAEGLAGDAALETFARFGWRVRLTGAEHIPELHEAAARLVAATPAHWQHTLWWAVAPDAGAPWRSILAAAQRSGASTREEAITALYGEPVPLSTLYLAFGKPIVVPDLIPPLLAGEIQCYWSQRPGYSLSEESWRNILYDYAYLRRTWSADSAARDLVALEQRAVWEQAGIIGLGQALGPFWFPLADTMAGAL
ncbi:MAG: hypothetical protein H7Y32_00225 [Chloroflexales bacterium]|nr:hypothetical protein [Chloroflexales bacterium]